MSDFIKINKDAQIVEVLTAQAMGERIDSKVTEDAEAAYAELYQNNDPMSRWQLAQLITYSVNNAVAKESDWLKYIADEKRVGYGDDAAFMVRSKGIKAFIQASGATTARSYVFNKQVILATETVSARPAVRLRDLRSGKIKVADITVEAIEAMRNAKLQKIAATLNSAASTNWASPFYATGAGVVKATLNPMIQHWLRTGGLAVVGDIAIIQKLAEQTGFTAATATQQFSPDLINEMNRTGRIGTFGGASVVQFVNPYLEDGKTTVLDQSYLYLLPTGMSTDERVLKVVTKGDVITVENTNIDDMTFEIRMDQEFGAGIAMGNTPTMSVYKDSSL